MDQGGDASAEDNRSSNEISFGPSRDRRGPNRLCTLEESNVLDLEVDVLKRLGIVGYPINTGISLSSNTTALRPSVSLPGGVGAEIDVEDKLLIDEMVVDVTLVLLEPNSGSSPCLSIGCISIHVGRNRIPSPTIEFDEVMGPLNGIYNMSVDGKEYYVVTLLTKTAFVFPGDHAHDDLAPLATDLCDCRLDGSLHTPSVPRCCLGGDTVKLKKSWTI